MYFFFNILLKPAITEQTETVQPRVVIILLVIYKIMESL